MPKKSAKAKRSPPGKPFQKGHKLHVGTRGKTAVELIPFLTDTLIDVVKRISIKEYFEVVRADGKVKLKLKKINANDAAAISNVAGRLIELKEQYKAGEEVRELRAQIEEMGQVITELLQGRTG